MQTDEIQLKFFAWSPFRSPAWRFEYAKEILAKPTRPCTSNDPWVDRALCHLSAEKTAVHANRSEKARFDPWIGQAQQIFADESDPKRRWFLEALLLTKEPYDQVAERSGLPVTVVEAYAALFFDVRSCPTATDWLLIKAVGCHPLNNFSGPQPGGIWKYYALFGGILVLELCMAATGDADWPDWLPQAAGSDDPAVIERFKQKLRLTYRMPLARSDEEVAAIIEQMELLRSFNDRPTERTEDFRAQLRMEQFLKDIPRLKRQRSKSPASKNRSKQQPQRSPRPQSPIQHPTVNIRKPK